MYLLVYVCPISKYCDIIMSKGGVHMDENKLIMPDPKCLQGNLSISMKHINVLGLQTMIENLNNIITTSSDSQEYAVASFVTSFGIVYGDIHDIEFDEKGGVSFNEDEKSMSIDISQVLYLRNKILEQEESLNPDTELNINFDGALINLKNVQVFYSNSQSSVELPQLLLYADAVLGMSYVIRNTQ